MNKNNLLTLLGSLLIILIIIGFQKSKSDYFNYQNNSNQDRIISNEANPQTVNNLPGEELKCVNSRVSALGFSVDCKGYRPFLFNDMLGFRESLDGPEMWGIGLSHNENEPGKTDYKTVEEFISQQQKYEERKGEGGIKLIKYLDAPAGKFAIFFNYVIVDMDSTKNRNIFAPEIVAVLVTKDYRTYIFSKRVIVEQPENDKEFEDILRSFRLEDTNKLGYSFKNLDENLEIIPTEQNIDSGYGWIWSATIGPKGEIGAFVSIFTFKGNIQKAIDAYYARNTRIKILSSEDTRVNNKPAKIILWNDTQSGDEIHGKEYFIQYIPDEVLIISGPNNQKLDNLVTSIEF